MFGKPEAIFAALAEDLGNRGGLALLDERVEIDERAPEPLGHHTADRALARAHEAGEEDVAHQAILSR